MSNISLPPKGPWKLHGFQDAWRHIASTNSISNQKQSTCYIHTHRRTLAPTHVHTPPHTHIYIYIDMYVCVCVCVYICVCAEGRRGVPASYPLSITPGHLPLGASPLPNSHPPPHTHTHTPGPLPLDNYSPLFFTPAGQSKSRFSNPFIYGAPLTYLRYKQGTCRRHEGLAATWKNIQ